MVMVAGIFTRLVPMELELVEMAGVLRYVDVGAKGPPIVSIVSIGFVLVMGVLLWRKNRFPWLFLTALLVFVGEGIPVEWIRRVLGSGGEVLFMATMLVLEEKISGK
jgi:hypothetical protein